jgi:hypothetical protein
MKKEDKPIEKKTKKIQEFQEPTKKQLVSPEIDDIPEKTSKEKERGKEEKKKE